MTIDPHPNRFLSVPVYGDEHGAYDADVVLLAVDRETLAQWRQLRGVVEYLRTELDADVRRLEVGADEIHVVSLGALDDDDLLTALEAPDLTDVTDAVLRAGGPDQVPREHLDTAVLRVSTTGIDWQFTVRWGQDVLYTERLTDTILEQLDEALTSDPPVR